MWHGVSVIEKPAAELISLAKLKHRLRVDDHDDDNDLLGDLLRQAIARIDGPSGIGYALLTQTWRKTMDCFPRQIVLPGAPIKRVKQISYVDPEGVTQTLPLERYRVALGIEPVRVEPAYGTAWPSTAPVIGAVAVEYELGEANAADVAPDLIAAVCMIVAHHNEHRVPVTAGQVSELPLGVQWILNEHARGHVAA